jgi:mannose/fructose/N-acetylgalactosamine-specific phosphotransferase system component IIB
MKIVLARIDDRFIHGQVTVGWIQKLQPDCIILANNEIASDPWQSRVYSSTVPPPVQVSVLKTSQTVAALSRQGEPGGSRPRTILITGNPADMHFIHRHTRMFTEINIGGMHFAPGKKEMLPYLYVDAQDLQIFQAFLDRGTRLRAQQVPGGRELDIQGDHLRDMEERF